MGGLPPDMQFKLIEPLKWLFKDEVREAGAEMGLAEEIIWRQPFDRSGDSHLGGCYPEKLEILRQADAIVHQEIKTRVYTGDLAILCRAVFDAECRSDGG